MKQKLQDIVILLQKDRKAQVIAVLVVLAIGYLMFSDGKSGLRQARYLAPEEQVQEGAGGMGQEEASTDIVRAMTGDLEKLQKENTDAQKRLDEQRKQMEDYERRTAEIFKSMLERQASIEAGLKTQGAPGVGPQPVNMVEGGMGEEEESVDELESFGNEPPPVAPPPQAADSKLAVIGVGDSVRAKLLAGVNAPTDGTPYPVVFKLVSDVYGPDGSALPIGEARVVAAAQGSLTDARALFRITSLNIRLPNGKRKFVDVDGWVVGEDGIRGMEGVLIDPLGKAIMAGGLVGGLYGLGQAVSQSQTTSYDSIYGSTEVVTGDDTKYAAGQAIAGAAQQWGSLLRDRVEQMVPHVQVLSGREGTVVFSKSVTIDELYDSLESEDNVFASMD